MCLVTHTNDIAPPHQWPLTIKWDC